MVMMPMPPISSETDANADHDDAFELRGPS